MKRRLVCGAALVVTCGFLGWAAASLAQTRLVVKSARAGTSYYALAIGTSKALMKVPGVEASVEESLGSVANVKEARARSNYLFTSTSDLIAQALKKTKPFEEGGYERIRTLWTFPGVVMHWVVRQDSGIKTIRDLEGKRFIAGGIGTATERLTRLVLKVYGLEGKVDLPAVDLKEGVDAVANRRAVGFTTGSPFPTPMVMELLATTPIRLLEIGEAEYKRLAEVDPTYSPTVIPADTYKGLSSDVKTVASPVLMYTTEDLPEELAYNLTKAFWENRRLVAEAHVTGKGLDMAGVRYGVAKVHPGAQRYYKEVGVEIPAAMR
ncbi:MAG TPA: TAXI family TRAP transporter solute-binding subunit [Candidatus Methylomirabilis sp.]|nr:TAXI family TRAP transporter solute-binding subunit [Candidatus Methylomirabilis sp.]